MCILKTDTSDSNNLNLFFAHWSVHVLTQLMEKKGERGKMTLTKPCG